MVIMMDRYERLDVADRENEYVVAGTFVDFNTANYRNILNFFDAVNSGQSPVARLVYQTQDDKKKVTMGMGFDVGQIYVWAAGPSSDYVRRALDDFLRKTKVAEHSEAA